MKLLEKIVNSLEPLTILPKKFILDIWPEAPEAIKKMTFNNSHGF